MIVVSKEERTITGFYVTASDNCDAGFEFIDVAESFGSSIAGWARFTWSMEYYFREAGASQITVVE